MKTWMKWDENFLEQNSTGMKTGMKSIMMAKNTSGTTRIGTGMKPGYTNGVHQF